MQAQKRRTKSALLIWTKSDLSDKVFNRYFTIWPQFGTGYFRFGLIYPDLVIRVTGFDVKFGMGFSSPQGWGLWKG